MQYVWTGKENREVWGIRFAPGVAVDVSETLAVKLSRLSGFELAEVKPRRRRKADDQEQA